MSINPQSFLSQGSQARYDATVEGAKANNALWTLADDNGCVILSNDTEQCLVVWHDEAIAKAWATDEFANTTPLKIELDAFIEKWVPGMTNDGFELIVGPDIEGEGIVVAPEEFAEELA
ncbi:DUF2750 domain-containing protein [Ferrimonas senticii]|uniref:DUF2750 domain-containing protein n=1 Tax=Ferrimonas senticii TaxID=394566 RepID=UPI00041E1F99|nr:DUF2750 domain-containing protein [Ferrimonas senticii]